MDTPNLPLMGPGPRNIKDVSKRAFFETKTIFSMTGTIKSLTKIPNSNMTMLHIRGVKSLFGIAAGDMILSDIPDFIKEGLEVDIFEDIEHIPPRKDTVLEQDDEDPSEEIPSYNILVFKVPYGVEDGVEDGVAKGHTEVVLHTKFFSNYEQYNIKGAIESIELKNEDITKKQEKITNEIVDGYSKTGAVWQERLDEVLNLVVQKIEKDGMGPTPTEPKE